MHDPRIGRFFAVDPLTSSYPHYTPYSFSGNKVIHAVELEGLEEVLLNENNEPTKVLVEEGSGPTHLANGINEYARANNYNEVTWKDVVNWNSDNFVANGVYQDMDNVNDKGYWDLNINQNDKLDIYLVPKSENSKPIVMPNRNAFSATWTTVDASAAAGIYVTANASAFDVPNDAEVWEAGLKVTTTSAGVGAGSVGADVSAGAGKITFRRSNNYSVADMMGKQALSTNGQFVSPVGVGAKYTHIFSDYYSVNAGSIVFGTPGFGVSTNSSDMGVSSFNARRTSFKGSRELETEQDSINQANFILKYNPNSVFFNNWLDNKTQQKLDSGEWKPVKN